MHPPDSPVNVKISASGSDVTVSWVQPRSGDAAESYTVTLTEQKTKADLGPVTGIPMRLYTRQDVPGGTYRARVSAVNSAGRSAEAQSDAVTTPAAESIDWNAVVDVQAVLDMEDAFDELTAQPHDDFWKGATDSLNNLGKPRSYEEQLVFARFLAMILTDPDPPASAQMDQYAAEIATSAVPPFPNQPRAAGDAYIDPLPLWTAASALLNKHGTALLPVRTQVFGLVRCLEGYLGQYKGT
jgi:hypothetical protein